MAESTAREPAVSSQQLNLIAKATHSEVDELRKQLSTLSCELKASEEAQLVLKRRIRAAQLHSADTEQALNAMSEKVVAAQQARDRLECREEELETDLYACQDQLQEMRATLRESDQLRAEEAAREQESSIHLLNKS